MNILLVYAFVFFSWLAALGLGIAIGRWIDDHE
jgi:hypothetical protein